MQKPILVMDNGRHLAELTQALRQAGYAPTVLPKGEDPVQRFTAMQPELVVMSLEGLDFSSVCERIRADPDGAIVPIILFGQNHPEVRSPADALAQGADYFFASPFDVKKVLTKI